MVLKKGGSFDGWNIGGVSLEKRRLVITSYTNKWSWESNEISS